MEKKQQITNQRKEMMIMEINKFIDQTILKAMAKKEDVKKICDEANK